jgi:ribosomal protein S1
MKRFILTLALIAAVAVTTMAAAGKTVSGKVTAIEGTKVTIAIEGDSADWVKKNGFVKFKVGPGKIVEVSAAGAKPTTIVVNSKKASDMKVGDAITFEKGLSVAGC